MGINNKVKKRAVFLDRDGVINRSLVRNGKPYPPADATELEILEGVPEALRKLKGAGFLLIVVTNQPDVARGSQSREAVEGLNALLLSKLAIDECCVCYHDDAHHCRCRKPAPGLLLDAARKRGVDLAESFMVGDRWRDIEAGERAGCVTIFVDHGYQEKQPKRYHAKVRSLAEAAEWILSFERGGI